MDLDRKRDPSILWAFDGSNLSTLEASRSPSDFVMKLPHEAGNACSR
jgi:hypothetical protein